MKRLSAFWLGLALSLVVLTATAGSFPKISSTPQSGWFPLTDAAICTDAADFPVVGIAASMLADDVERVAGRRPMLIQSRQLPKGTCVVAGTLGHSRLKQCVACALRRSHVEPRGHAASAERH